MEITQDKLVNSPICDSNACYESEFQTQDGPIKTWLCMTSGYTSNTTMTLDSEALKQTLELTADLIKDLRQDHEPPGGGEVLAWFPTAITMPEKGVSQLVSVDLQKAEQYGDSLRDKLQQLNLVKDALTDAKDLEGRMNGATAKIWREITADTGGDGGRPIPNWLQQSKAASGDQDNNKNRERYKKQT